MIREGLPFLIELPTLPASMPYRCRGAGDQVKNNQSLQAWSDSLRAELACQGVDVLVVSPGYVKTELSRNAITEKVKLKADSIRNVPKAIGHNFRAQLMERWMPAQRRATVLLG